MGFLLMSYYRQTTGQKVHRCQKELMDITRRCNLARKQAEQCKKSIESQFKCAKNDAMAQANAAMSAFKQQMEAYHGIDSSMDVNNMTPEQKQSVAQVQQAIYSKNMEIQQQLAAYNNQLELWKENMLENQYEPLAEEDKLLIQEKELKQEDLELAKEEHNKAKSASSEEIKNIVPTFGGGQ